MRGREKKKRARPSGLVLAAAAISVWAGACANPGKVSEKNAQLHAAKLAELAKKDVLEIDQGLPEGAKKLAPLYAKGDDPRSNLPQVRKDLQRIRRDVPDLLTAKSTFFALADDKGVAIRNDLEQDAMANQNLVALFPDLARAKDACATTTGAFPGPPGVSGPDRDWIAACPIKGADGKTAGMLVTGWTYRGFSRHLQESLKRDISEQTRTASDPGKLPILYVGVFDKTGVYMAPLTPKIDEDEFTKMNLVERTAGGRAQGNLLLTERAFGWAAERVEKLGADTGILVPRSEI